VLHADVRRHAVCKGQARRILGQVNQLRIVLCGQCGQHLVPAQEALGDQDFAHRGFDPMLHMKCIQQVAILDNTRIDKVATQRSRRRWFAGGAWLREEKSWITHVRATSHLQM
jgi:hypothetical protein